MSPSPPNASAPQLTPRAVLTGAVLGFVLSFTNVYIGLKTGWFLGVALTACVASYGAWAVLARLGLARAPMTILETNCAQSTASAAGYSTGNTIISAIPALLMLSVDAAHPFGVQRPFFVVALWLFFLALLGVSLAIPLKRGLIDIEQLPFPSGTAAAETLRGLYERGAEAAGRARALLVAAAVAALGALLTGLPVRGHPLLPSRFNVFDALPGMGRYKLSDANVSIDASVALVCAGALVGLRVAAWMLVGALALVFGLTPLALDAHWTDATGKVIAAATHPGTSWREIGLWAGAPMLVASGLTTLAFRLRSVGRALAGAAAMGEGRSGANEVPRTWFYAGTLAATVGIVLVARVWFSVPVALGLLAVAMSAAFAVVASRVTGETDITPGNAMSKLTQLGYGLIAPQSYAANVMTASITAGSSLASADLLTDLKAGHLLGAKPRSQFIAQALGTGVGAVASTLAYFVLVPDARVLVGVAGAPPTFAAPSAQQWKAVAELFRYGLGNLHPMCQRAALVGLVMGVVLSVGEQLAPKRAQAWVPSPSGLGLGLMLPFSSSLAMFGGAAIAAVVRRVSARSAELYVPMVAAGGIAGESIAGVLVQVANQWLR